MAAVELAQPQPLPVGPEAETKITSEEKSPKLKALEDETEGEPDILFSCNICYDVSTSPFRFHQHPAFFVFHGFLLAPLPPSSPTFPAHISSTLSSQLASEPVVTLCGHLYCWPCLYRWLQVQNHCRTCPVCKAGVDRDKVIPIYGRGGNEDPRGKTKDVTELDVPSRPAGQRPAPVMRNPLIQPNQVNMGPAQQGLGIIPTLFGLQGPQGQGGYSEPLTPEQQHQAFLSRLLLMLGSFVIMCLLLF